MKTFKHSGDLGDIIYSLALIKQMGGGILLLDTTGGKDDPNCKLIRGSGTKFTKEGYDFIKPLVDKQPYIKECREWTESDKVDVNLNEFRQCFSYYAGQGKFANLTLLDLYFEQFGFKKLDYNESWIISDKKEHDDPNRFVALSRTPRYQCSHIWFETHCKRLSNEAFFLGLEKEHEYFQWTFGIELPHQKVKDASELSEYIAGSKLLVANGSLALAIGIGLGDVFIINEPFPTTTFRGKRNMFHLGMI